MAARIGETTLKETTLKLSRVGGYERVTIPYPDPWIARYLVGIFVLAWLGGWAYGEAFALTEIFLGNASGFHVFWLIAWTVGGICAAVTAFQLLRPGRPETFTLETDGVRYDRACRRQNWARGEPRIRRPGPV